MDGVVGVSGGEGRAAPVEMLDMVRFRIPLSLRAATMSVTSLVVMSVAGAACSDDRDARCIQSGDASVCLVPDDDMRWTVDVSGFQPGTTFSWSTDPARGGLDVLIGDDGGIDGKAGNVGAGGKAGTVEFAGTVQGGARFSGSLALD